MRMEKWSTDVMPFFAGADGLSAMESINEMQRLSVREAVIIGGAGLDAALAEMLAQRLVGEPKAIEKFLGLDGNANAPVGTFSARIQLASLVGIIRTLEADALDGLRDLRNQLAHRVNIDVTTDKPFARIEKLYQYLDLVMKDVGGASTFGTLERTESDAKAVVVLAVFGLHHLFNDVSKIVGKIPLVTIPRPDQPGCL